MRHNPKNCPHCIRLGTLLGHLEKMNQGAHQWLTLPSAGTFISLDGEIQRYLIVGYSNPDSTGLPNALKLAADPSAQAA